jgi:hypothetical protein
VSLSLRLECFFLLPPRRNPPLTPKTKKKPPQKPDCAEGYGLAPFAYGAKAHKPKLMVCAPCPQGTFSDGGSYSTTLCERCPTGSTTATPTSTSADDCNICQSGFAGDPDAGTPCKLCAAGSYADPDNNAECTDCPDGFTTPKAGSTSEDQCYIAVCDAGEQSVKGKCYECADGWTSDKVRDDLREVES